MTRYAIAEDYSRTHFGRQVLQIWSGAFASDFEGEATALPKGDGFMVTMRDGEKVRVTTAAPRTDKNFLQVDRALNARINAFYEDKHYVETGEILQK